MRYKVFSFLNNQVKRLQNKIEILIYRLLHSKQIINESNKTLDEIAFTANHLTNKILDYNYDNNYEDSTLENYILQQHKDLLVSYYVLKLFHFQILSFILKTKLSPSIKPILKKLKTLDSNYKRLDDMKSFFALKANIMKKYKYYEKEFKTLINNRINESKESMAIEITLGNILSFFTFIYILLILGGVLYNQLIFGSLNIKVSYYFNISDYLSSNIDILTNMFYTLIATIFLGYMTLTDGIHNNIVKENMTYLEYNDKKTDIQYYIILIIMISSTVLLYLTNNDYYIIWLTTTLILVLMNHMHSFEIWHYIKNRGKIFIYIWLTSIFILQIVLQYQTNISAIKKHSYNQEFKIKAHKTNNDYNLSKYVYLLTNSQYSFFYSKEDNSSLIIPNNAIKEIIVKRTNE